MHNRLYPVYHAHVCANRVIFNYDNIHLFKPLLFGIPTHTTQCMHAHTHSHMRMRSVYLMHASIGAGTTVIAMWLVHGMPAHVCASVCVCATVVSVENISDPQYRPRIRTTHIPDAVVLALAHATHCVCVCMRFICVCIIVNVNNLNIISDTHTRAHCDVCTQTHTHTRAPAP